MAENLEKSNSKLYLATQILSAIGIILVIVYMIQNISYLLAEIFRNSVQMSTFMTYIIGLMPYLLCAAAYILFLFKKKNAGLIFAFLAIYRIINLIASVIISKSIQSNLLIDIIITIAAAILFLILIAEKAPAPVLKWLLAACTIAFTFYNIIINLTYLNNLLQSISKTKSSFWPSILGILNFFNLYILIASCFCLMLLMIEKKKDSGKLST